MSRLSLHAIFAVPCAVFFAGSAQAQAPSASVDPSAAREPPTREYVVDDDLPPPSTRWKLVLGGVATTAAFYGAVQPFSYAWPDAPGGYDLRIPVVGPWMALADTGCAEDNPDCSQVWVVARAILTAIDGLGQAGGIALAFEGIFLPTSSKAPAPAPSPAIPHYTPGEPRPEQPPPAQPEKIFLAPTPMPVGQNGMGFGLYGAF